MDIEEIFLRGVRMEEIRKQIMETLNFRHACKEFKEGCLIPAEDFTVIMEAARLSPSSFGFEPWKILILQDMRLREKIRPVVWGAQKQLPTASHFLILLARKRGEILPDSEYLWDMMRNVQHLSGEQYAAKKARYENFLKNDFQIWDGEEKMFGWACRQTYIALSNMLTAAAWMKIDSCAIEGFDREKAEQILEKEGFLDREMFGICCMAAFGYRKNVQGQKLRRDLSRVFERIG